MNCFFEKPRQESAQEKSSDFVFSETLDLDNWDDTVHTHIYIYKSTHIGMCLAKNLSKVPLEIYIYVRKKKKQYTLWSYVAFRNKHQIQFITSLDYKYSVFKGDCTAVNYNSISL